MVGRSSHAGPTELGAGMTWQGRRQPGNWRTLKTTVLATWHTPGRDWIRPGDPADMHADLLPGVKRVTIVNDGNPDRLLSAIVASYAASGRTDQRWWADQ